jgi:hypothetical protein
MKVRELLQTQIWSKSISRKIFIGVGLVLVVVGPLFLLSSFWLTPPERVAAMDAVSQIDALQIVVLSDSNDDFAFKRHHAEESVKVAVRAALTERDQRTSLLLSSYLSTVELRRLQVRARTLKMKRPLSVEQWQGLEDELKDDGIQQRRSLGEALNIRQDK